MAPVDEHDPQPFPRIHHNPGARAQQCRAAWLSSGRRCGGAVICREFDTQGRCGGGKRDGLPCARAHACSGLAARARASPATWLRVPGARRPARRWGCPSARAAAGRLRLVPHARLGAADPGPRAAPRPQRKPPRGEELRGGLQALHERPCRFAPPSPHHFFTQPKGSPHASGAPFLACGAVNRSLQARLMPLHRGLRIRPRGLWLFACSPALNV